MFQEERRISSTTSSVTSSVSSDISVIHHQNKMDLLQDYFDEAKKFVGRALKLDEKSDRMSALELYNKALNSIQSGLSVVKSSPQVTSAMKEMKKKMEKLKDQVKSRMEVLLEEESKSRSKGSSRTDSHTIQTGSHAPSMTIGSTTSIGTKTTDGRGGRDTIGAEANLVFSSSTGCKVIRVNENGTVLKCTPADSLNIFRYKHQIPGQPIAFLQCGDFVYPLIPGQSPVLHSSYKAYVFPDVESNAGNVGILFNELPRHELEELNRLFSGLSDFKVSGEERSQGTPATSTTNDIPNDDPNDDKEGAATWGSSISEKIDAGVTWMSEAISNGTSKAGELLNKGGDKLRGSIEPREEAVEIPQPVEKGFYYAKKASGVVVGVSDFLMMNLARGTVAVGKKVGNIVAESDMVKEREINPHAMEAWKVTKSSVKGAGRMFGDLELAAKSIIKGAGQETSKTVGHKYGEQAGRVSDDGLVTVGNTVDLASTYWNWKTWGISFIGKVGKVIAGQDDQKEKEVEKKPEVVSPDLSKRSVDSSISQTNEPVTKPHLHHVKPKKEVLYA